MKGKYKNLEGETMEILQHDEANKIVYIQNSEGEKKWIASEECKWWQSLEAKPETVEEIKMEKIKSLEPPVGVSVPIEKLEEEIKPKPVVMPEAKEAPKLIIEKEHVKAATHHQKSKKK